MANSGWRRPWRTRPSKRREVMLDLPHNSIKAIGEKGGRELDGGYKAGASLTAAATRMQASRWWRCRRRRLGRLAADVSDAKARERNTEPWGRTPWFYRGNGRKKGTRPPQSPGLPRALLRHIVGHAPVIPILSHRNRAGRFAFPSDWTLFPQRGHGREKFLL